MLNRSTLRMYLGRSVSMVKKPQSCPTWMTMRPHTGNDVRMPLHGVRPRNAPLDTCSEQVAYAFRKRSGRRSAREVDWPATPQRRAGLPTWAGPAKSPTTL